MNFEHGMEGINKSKWNWLEKTEIVVFLICCLRFWILVFWKNGFSFSSFVIDWNWMALGPIAVSRGKRHRGPSRRASTIRSSAGIAWCSTHTLLSCLQVWFDGCRRLNTMVSFFYSSSFDSWYRKRKSRDQRYTIDVTVKTSPWKWSCLSFSRSTIAVLFHQLVLSDYPPLFYVLHFTSMFVFIFPLLFDNWRHRDIFMFWSGRLADYIRSIPSTVWRR